MLNSLYELALAGLEPRKERQMKASISFFEIPGAER